MINNENVVSVKEAGSGRGKEQNRSWKKNGSNKTKKQKHSWQEVSYFVFGYLLEKLQ